MTQYHVSGDGNPRPCKAQPDQCPIGGDGKHFDNADAARQHYETTQGESITSIKRSTADTRLASLPPIKNVEYEKDPWGEGVTEDGLSYTSVETFRTGRNGTRTRLADITVYEDNTVIVWDKSGSTITDVKARDNLKKELKKNHKISPYSSPVFYNDF